MCQTKTISLKQFASIHKTYISKYASNTNGRTPSHINYVNDKDMDLSLKYHEQQRWSKSIEIMLVGKTIDVVFD